MSKTMMLLTSILAFLVFTANAFANEYCVLTQDPEMGSFLDIRRSKTGLLVPFSSYESSPETDKIGIELLNDRVFEGLVHSQDRVKPLATEIVDKTKIYVAFYGELYIPQDIAEWPKTKKNIDIQARWFENLGKKFVLITAGINKDAFISNDRSDYSDNYQYEAVYEYDAKTELFRKIISEKSIMTLDFKNNDLIIGTYASFYESSGGTVYKYDGNELVQICDWSNGF